MKFILNIYRSCTQPIDFDGQEKAKNLLFSLFALGFVFSYILGIVMNDLKYTLFAGIATTVIVAIVIIPPWPMYRRKGINFKEKAKSD